MLREDGIIQLLDIYNKELLSQVHPENWKNPEPKGRYNLVVLGAGTAGLVAAAGAAGLGAKVALIKKILWAGIALIWAVCLQRQLSGLPESFPK